MATLTIKGMPDELYKRLKKRANEERRSINSQVIVCLQLQLATPRRDPKAVLKRIDALRERLNLPAMTVEEFRKAKESGRL